MFKRKKKDRPYLEISLTPLIDTALTLLIIFMVTTPMIQKHAVKIDLPKGNAKEGGAEQQELVVSIDKQENIYFNNEPTTLESLPHKITSALQDSKEEKIVWMRVDSACQAGCFMSAISSIKVLPGVKNVTIATEQNSGKAA